MKEAETQGPAFSGTAIVTFESTYRDTFKIHHVSVSYRVINYTILTPALFPNVFSMPPFNYSEVKLLTLKMSSYYWGHNIIIMWAAVAICSTALSTTINTST
jgi:hypothetical protein